MSPEEKLSSLSPVLIMDDDEFFRVAIDAVLRTRIGIETVIACATLEEALEQLSSDIVFGLGLVDLNMAGIGNRALLDTFNAAQPHSRLVVLSASRSRDDILMALTAGAQGFINKGLGIDETELALRKIAEGTVYVPPFTPQAAVSADAPARTAERTPVPLAALTPRQVEVLKLLVAGLPNKGIARELDINPSTVKFHLSFIFQILGASNRVEAAMLGADLLRHGE